MKVQEKITVLDVEKNMKTNIDNEIYEIKRKIESSEYIVGLEAYMRGFDEAIDICIKELKKKKNNKRLIEYLTSLKKKK